jgi:hypothetical protein
MSHGSNPTKTPLMAGVVDIPEQRGILATGKGAKRA